MKTKVFISMAVCMLCASIARAQIVFSSDLSSWAGNPLLPTDFMGSKTNLEPDSITQISAGTQYGIYSARLINEQNTHRRFTTQPLQVDSSFTYTIKVWARGQGDIRFGLFDGRAANFGYANYTNYTTLNTPTNTLLTGSIVCENDTAMGEFIISVRYTVAPQHIIIDSVVIEKQGIVPPPFVPIYDIQYTTNPGGNSPYLSQTVQTGGIVTATYASGYFIQNGIGAWNGLFVYDNVNSPSVGDSVVVTGTIAEYFNMTEMNNVSAFTIISSGNPLPAPFIVTTAQAKTEPYEGVLCKVLSAQCTNPNAGFGLWTVNNGGNGDTLKVDKIIYQYPNPVSGKYYNITGVMNYAYGEFRIAPRNINDVEELTGISETLTPPTVIFPLPASKQLYIRTSAQTTLSIFNLQGKKIWQQYSNSGLENIDLTTFPAGYYVLIITDREGNRNMQKFEIFR